MSSFGHVLQVYIPTGKKFAYVSFDRSDEKEAALRMREVFVEGCTVKMDSAIKQGSAPPKFQGAGPPGNPERDGRDSRQFSYGDNRGNIREFRDDRRFSSSAPSRATQQSNLRSRKTNSTRSFSPCSSLKTSVEDAMGASELLCNLTAGDCGKTGEGKRAKQDGCAPVDRKGMKTVNESYRSTLHCNREDVANKQRADACSVPSIAGQTSAYSDSKCERMAQEQHALDNARTGTMHFETDTKREEIRSRRASSGSRELATHGQAADMQVENVTCLIKPQIMTATPLEVMGWIDKTSFASLPLGDVLQCLERYISILDSADTRGAEMHQLSAEEHVPLKRLLQQCHGLLPVVEQFVVTYSSNAAPVVTATHEAEHRRSREAESTRGAQQSTSHLYKDRCSNRDLKKIAAVAQGSESTGSIAGVTREDDPGLDGGRVCKVFAAVTRLYSASVLHWFADSTKVIAREVCKRCQETLICMAACVTSLLESAFRDQSQSALDGLAGFRADDMIDVLRVSAQLASSLDAVKGSLVQEDFADLTALQGYVCAVGRWLPLKLTCPESLVLSRSRSHKLDPTSRTRLPQPAHTQTASSATHFDCTQGSQSPDGSDRASHCIAHHSSAPHNNDIFASTLDRHLLGGDTAHAGSCRSPRSWYTQRSLTPLTIHESVQGQCRKCRDGVQGEVECCAVKCCASHLVLGDRTTDFLLVCTVLSSYAHLQCHPPAELQALLSLPVCPEGSSLFLQSRAPACDQVEHHHHPSSISAADYAAALDPSHASRLLVAIARLPQTKQRPWLPVLTALLEKTLKKHVMAAMSPEEHVQLLCAYPYHVAEVSNVLEGAPHKSKTPQEVLALRLFRALVERLCDRTHQLTGTQLASIARAHVCHLQVLTCLFVYERAPMAGAQVCVQVGLTAHVLVAGSRRHRHCDVASLGRHRSVSWRD